MKFIHLMDFLVPQPFCQRFAEEIPETLLKLRSSKKN